MSAVTFTDLGASETVVRALRANSITAPFAIQNLVVGDAIAGRDVIAKSPTGSGKTLAFGIPLVERTAAESKRPAALVLAPTRELATQIVDDLQPIAHARALRVAAVYGGVGIIKQAQIAARAHIIVATPGRLEDLLQRRAFTLDNIRMLVLDEADRMLDMGFRPAIERIVEACPADRQTLCFSATLDGEAGALAKRYVSGHVTHEHTPAADPNAGEIEHRFVPIQHSDRVEALVEQLNVKRDLALVFVRTKHGADKLVKKLSNHGVFAVAMHGNKTQRQRERALAQFDSGDIDTLVATDVAARGIDIDRISHVINFDPPDGADTYTHRVGRTGRAGRDGIGITLVATDQHREVARMANELGLEHDLGGPAKAYMQFPTKLRPQASESRTSTGDTRHATDSRKPYGGSRKPSGESRKPPREARKLAADSTDDRSRDRRDSRAQPDGERRDDGARRADGQRRNDGERRFERDDRPRRDDKRRGPKSSKPRAHRGESADASRHADAGTASGASAKKRPHRGQGGDPKPKKHQSRQRDQRRAAQS